MVEVQSNNPYRRSMSPPQPPPAAAGQQYQLSAYGSSSPTESGSPQPPPLAKFPSATTTIAEEPEPESDYHRQGHSRASTPTVIVKGCDDKDADGPEVVITIHQTVSTSTVQQPEYPMPIRTNTHPHPRQSMSADTKPCDVWPARRFIQKRLKQKKTKWIIIKVTLALIFVIGAVAIGLGISRAARG